MKYERNGMQFDWDDQKSKINLAKHGRSFEDGYLVWSEPFGELLAGNVETEERLVRRGMIDNQVWLCVYTMRNEGNTMTKKKVPVEEFDKMVDEGGDLSDVLVPVNSIKSVMIDLPTWMITALDDEARRLNVARKALINIWLADRLHNNQLASEKKKA